MNQESFIALALSPSHSFHSFILPQILISKPTCRLVSSTQWKPTRVVNNFAGGVEYRPWQRMRISIKLISLVLMQITKTCIPLISPLSAQYPVLERSSERTLTEFKRIVSFSLSNRFGLFDGWLSKVSQQSLQPFLCLSPPFYLFFLSSQTKQKVLGL